MSMLFVQSKKFDTLEHEHLFILLYGSLVCHLADSDEEEFFSVECYIYHMTRTAPRALSLENFEKIPV